MNEREIKLELFERELARRRYLSFITYTKPDYDVNWHHEALCKAVEQWLAIGKNLIVMMPPQTGKSETTTRRLAPYLLGKDGTKRIAICAYNQTHASSFIRDCKRIMYDPAYRNVFPDAPIPKENDRTLENSSQKIEMDGTGGYLVGAGVGGALTGVSVDIGIIDDPVKDSLEANSKTYRDRLWDWYVSVFKTRLHKDSKQIITMTRWHEDDLIGRILASEPEKWEVVVFRGIKENGDSDLSDPRMIGDALWPGRHTLESYLSIKQASPRVFNSMYQQRPTAQEGGIFKYDYFDIVPASEMPDSFWDLRVYQTVDTAFTKSTQNDPSGFLDYCVFENTIYIIDWRSKHFEFTDLCKYIESEARAYQLDQRQLVVYVEPKASGKSTVQHVRKTTNVTISEYKGDLSVDKVARANDAQPFCEGKRVRLIKGAWNSVFLEELASFPNAAHDEAVDCLVMAINLTFAQEGKRIRRGGRPLAGIS